ncbi:MAG: hypothetical protein HZB38_17645 [Planctomycetes bacterium]|nr:hypothetical protein [Planctomycetota bacterium]
MFRNSWTPLVGGVIFGLSVFSATAGEREWSQTVSACKAGEVIVWVTYPGNPPLPFRVEVSQHLNGADKAAEIATTLAGSERVPGPLRSFNPRASGSTLMFTADDRISIRFDVGTSAETDSLRCGGANSGTAGFESGSPFNPFDLSGQPALFTAGIVTDVGELTATVSAQELNFQTDGPIICQALYQRLSPRTAQYGAQINYAGDRLEVYFDPAYTVVQGGMTFGTTSGSPGVYGAVVPHTQPPCIGDVDGDGEVGLTDLTSFLAAFGSRVGDLLYRFEADFDGDGEIGLIDLTTLLSNYGAIC